VPKIKVLTHVFNNSEPKTRIIVRDSYLNIEKILKRLGLENDIIMVKKMWNYPVATIKWESVYLKKN